MRPLACALAVLAAGCHATARPHCCDALLGRWKVVAFDPVPVVDTGGVTGNLVIGGTLATVERDALVLELAGESTRLHLRRAPDGAACELALEDDHQHAVRERAECEDATHFRTRGMRLFGYGERMNEHAIRWERVVRRASAPPRASRDTDPRAFVLHLIDVLARDDRDEWPGLLSARQRARTPEWTVGAQMNGWRRELVPRRDAMRTARCRVDASGPPFLVCEVAGEKDLALQVAWEDGALRLDEN